MKRISKKIKKQNKLKLIKKRKKEFEQKKFSKIELEGILKGSGHGYAYFIPDDKSGDLFVSSDDLCGAIHGDRVIVRKISQNKGNGEGRVVRILERTKAVFVATCNKDRAYTKEHGMMEFLPIVNADSVAYSDGDLVVCQMIDDQPIFCKVIENLGQDGLTDADIMGIIRSYGIAEKFPKGVIDEANRIPDSVTEGDFIGRQDFTQDLTVTIDGEHSKDFDDAICVKRKQNGYELGVHIADVAHYVNAGSQIDEEAFNRGTSVYFADRVLPMLPEKLSNNICSLVENENRLTLSVIIDLDENGQVLKGKIYEGVIKSKARLTYTEVADILEGGANANNRSEQIISMLNIARELALKLKANRLKRGSVEFELTETEFDFDKDKNVVGIHPLARLISHEMIEEFMLCANETVAKKYYLKKAPFVYRVHEAPPPEKIQALCEFLESLDVEFTDQPSPKDYAELLKNIDSELIGVVSMVALRSMSKADYRPECKGHFGLSATYYCHFTSPIRRYPDLAIHRIIKSSLRGDSLSGYKSWVRGVSSNSSQRERVADEAERKVDDLLKAKFMSNKIGFEYEGIISGVTDRGLFVELDNSVEGMVKTESLDGYFVFNPKTLSLSRGLTCYRLGDRVTIRVESVNFDKIAFSLIEE